jgi:hypothetical protein
MPLFAYQSFNSNSSTNHGLNSISFQYFTKQTSRRIVKAQRKVLQAPFISGNMSAPVQGPANLINVKPLDELMVVEPATRKRQHDDTAQGASKRRKLDTDTTDNAAQSDDDAELNPSWMFGSQISLAWQNFNRQFGEMPALMICGELDASHQDFKNLVDDEAVTVKPLPSNKASQSFTAISRNAIGATFIKSGTGFVAYTVANLNVVFVHVPNEIANSKNQLMLFYKGIAQSLLGDGKIIHLVMGDTNQRSGNVTKTALNSAFSTDAYANAHDGKTIAPIDYYNVSESGSNSNGKTLYDVAVYRSDLVKLTKDVAYLSQSSNAITVTDHCGLGVFAELK